MHAYAESPTLTTIDYPGVEIGKTAAMSLLSHLSGDCPLVAGKTAVVAAELIVRGSSLKLPGHGSF
jgi:LacI family transcriptional regulator